MPHPPEPDLAFRAFAGLAAGLLLACAQGNPGQQNDASQHHWPDAAVQNDAAPQPDAAVQNDAAPQPDAAVQNDAAPQPDAAVQNDAAPQPDAGCTPTTQQLLANPGFDQGSGVSWVEQGNDPLYPLVTPAADLPVTPQAGGYAVWLGGAYSETHVLYQDVVVPAGATNLTLSGYVWVSSEDSGTWDWATLSILTPGNVLLQSLVTWDCDDTGTAWVAFSYPLGAYAGQTLRVYLQASLDSYLNTNFFLDSFALNATVCQ